MKAFREHPYILAADEAIETLWYFYGEEGHDPADDARFRRSVRRVAPRMETRRDALAVLLAVDGDQAAIALLKRLIANDIRTTFRLLPCLGGILYRFYTERPQYVVNGIGYSFYDEAPPQEIVWPLSESA